MKQLTNLGKTLRKIRIDHDMSLGKMATMLKISPGYLSCIEFGERKIPDDFYQKFGTLKEKGIITAEELSLIWEAITNTKEEFTLTPKTPLERFIFGKFAEGNLTEKQLTAIAIELGIAKLRMITKHN